jgi:hypothetical protein
MRWGSPARAAAALAAASLGVFPALVRADSFTPVSVGVQTGTLGSGITLERPLLFNFSVRLQTGWLSTSDTPTIAGGPWARDFHEQNVLLAGDWRPDAGRYRFTAGLLLGGDNTTFVAKSVDGINVIVNNHAYPTAQAGIVSANVGYGRPTLYLGGGIGTGITRGFAVAFDAGIVYRNGAVTTGATGPLANDPRFAADLQTLAGQIPHRGIQPVVDVGLVYRP